MPNLPLALRCIGIVLAMMAVACGPVVEGSPTAAAEARTSTSMPVDLLAGVPGDCRLLQPGEGADGRVARQVLAGLKISADPGPLVAVDASSTLAVVASTLYTGDGDQGQTTVWTVDTDTLTVLAANAAAAEVSGFDVQLVDTAGEGAVRWPRLRERLPVPAGITPQMSRLAWDPRTVGHRRCGHLPVRVPGRWERPTGTGSRAPVGSGVHARCGSSLRPVRAARPKGQLHNR